jgi:hypothetical protein
MTDLCKSYHHRNDLPNSPKYYVQLSFPTQKGVHTTIKWVPGNHFFSVAFSPMEPMEKKQY